jgi:hypothetical protein
VHWAYGGKGLQTGLQDAGNLGWKLAAQIHGWAPPDLLDTYHAERHPIGERLMTLTRAQEALARPGEHVSALRTLFTRLLAQETVFRALAEEITDVDICYQMTGDGGNPHPLLGRWAPNLVLQNESGTIHFAELLRAGKGVLLDRGGRAALSATASKWADRIETTTGHCEDRSAIGSADGDVESERSLWAALENWFGRAVIG